MLGILSGDGVFLGTTFRFWAGSQASMVQRYRHLHNTHTSEFGESYCFLAEEKQHLNSPEFANLEKISKDNIYY